MSTRIDIIQLQSSSPAPIGATLMKTGQTVSYRTGDDGDIQAGRETDFFTLPSNNPFGNTNRFTDELGTQVYTNDIVIDWSTYNGSDVLGYKITEYSVTSWNQAIDDCLATSISIFTSNWHLTNVYELENICWWGSTSQLNHSSSGSPSPFVLGGTWEAWTSNTYFGATSQSITRTHFGTRISRAKTSTAPTKAWACRNFTVTGTTLS
jgi:hypothetical protein